MKSIIWTFVKNLAFHNLVMKITQNYYVSPIDIVH
jgi:hypothetical protein